MTPIVAKKVIDDEVVTYSAYLASGNTQTCTAQGFIYILSLRLWNSYYAALMILYWFIVHYGWKENRTNNPRLRMIFILPPIIIAFGLAIPPLFLGMYNYPGRFVCAICDFPYGCTQSDEVDCERGEGGVTYSNYSHGYTVFCAVIMITFVCMLVYEIYQQEKRTDQFLSSVGTERRGVNLTVKTAWRGIEYIGVYFICYLPSFVSLGYRASGNLDIPDVIDYLYVILLPLLGFFNAFVYFRPRYMNYKKCNPDSSWIVCMKSVLQVRAINPKMFESMQSIKDRMRRSSSMNVVEDSDADHGDLPSSIVSREVDDTETDLKDLPNTLVRDSVEP